MMFFNGNLFPLSITLQGDDWRWPPPNTQTKKRVYVGVYLSDVSGFDLREGRFKADLQLWCKWLGGEEPPKIVLSNGEIESQTEIAREADGDWRSIRWRVQGTFRGTLPLHEFPFDRQRLRIDSGNTWRTRTLRSARSESQIESRSRELSRLAALGASFWTAPSLKM